MEEEIQKQSNPWSRRQEIGFLNALWQTAKQVLFRPREFFANLEIAGSHFEPFSFYFIFVMSGTIISSLWSLLFFKKLQANNPNSIWMLGSLVIFIPIFLYLGAAIFHLGVMLFRGKGGFRGTLNVLAYAGATSIFEVVPLIGGFVRAIWAIVVMIIGLREVHKFTTGRAVSAYAASILFLLIPLLAAIAIPNALRARLVANERQAEAVLITISTAAETFKAANSKYPSSENDLTQAKPAYLDRAYNNKIIQGYDYSSNFHSDGYEITAKPIICGSTGREIIKAATGGKILKEGCKP